MGKRGPAPKSTAQKELENNPGRYPIESEEPKFSTVIVIPDHITKNKVALAEWNRRAPELEEKKVLTLQDTTEFAAYCLMHANFLKYQKLCDQDEVGEFAIAKGHVNAVIKFNAERVRLAAKFGFTPSDRTQVKIPKDNKDPLSEWQKKKPRFNVISNAKFVQSKKEQA